MRVVLSTALILPTFLHFTLYKCFLKFKTKFPFLFTNFYLLFILHYYYYIAPCNISVHNVTARGAEGPRQQELYNTVVLTNWHSSSVCKETGQ